MLGYVIRRILYILPLLLLVNAITFVLFFMINSPDDMARAHLGNKYITPDQISQWKVAHGYDKPLYYNKSQQGDKKWLDTLFVKELSQQFSFHFGRSDQGRDINADIGQRFWPSLALALPAFILSFYSNLLFALLLVLLRYSPWERWGNTLTLLGLSISGLFYIIGGQYLIGKVMKIVPLSGYQSGWFALPFLCLPVAVSVISGLGPGVRWYQNLLLTALDQPYVKTARASGLSEWRTLTHHVLPNALLPILTSVVALIPSLFLGSLLLESFFGIPGMGSYMIEAIQAQDFAIVRVMVFLGTLLYIVGLILTDLSYAWADPRIRLS